MFLFVYLFKYDSSSSDGGGGGGEGWEQMERRKGREGVIGYGTYTVRYSSTVRVSYSDRKVCK